MLEAIFSGLVIGAIYALVALSFSIIFATTNIVNFALGEVVMVACMMALTTLVTLQWPVLAGILLTILVVLLLSYFLQLIALKRLQRVDPNTAFMLTLAVGIILNNAALLIWGDKPFPFPSLLGERIIFHIGRLAVNQQGIGVIAAAILLMAVVDWFQRKTLIGKAMVATSLDREAASAVGINVNLIYTLSFAMSALLAAAAAFLIAPFTFASYYMGTDIGLKGFAAAILGSLSQGRGAIVGGLLFGLAEAVLSYLFGSNARDPMLYLAFILVLMVKPTGLFGLSRWQRLA
jgi:branched-chain amino acid transport system permease protein